LSFDLTADIALGKKLDIIHNPNHEFSSAFEGINQLCMSRLPGWKILKFLQIGSEKALKAYSETITKFMGQVVAERKKTRDTPGFQDVMLMFIEEYRKTGEPINDDVLRDVALTFLIAGRDTVGWTLTMMLYVLMLHPEVEEKILEEIFDTVGNNPVTSENASLLVYVQAVMYEVLRLYPPVSIDYKLAIHEDQLPDGTKVEPGDCFNYSPWAQGRDPHIWENPKKFDPNRWIVDGKFHARSEYEFVAFNAGPRLCLGKSMAIFEVKALLVEILRVFKFSSVDPLMPEPQTRFGTTLLLTNGLPVYVQRRDTKGILGDRSESRR